MSPIYYYILLVIFCGGAFTETTTRKPTAKDLEKLKKSSTHNIHPKVEEFKKNGRLRPTKCQVCRVMVQEIAVELNKTKDIKEKLQISNGLDGKKQKYHIEYKNSELRLTDALEKVCGNVEYYRAIAGPDFPYLRDVRSMYRQELEDMMAASGLNLQVDAPQHAIDDPTLEIRRLHFECNQMVEEYEEEILDWFNGDQNIPLTEFVCRDHVLNKNNDDCLKATTTIPDWGIKTKPIEANGKIHEFAKNLKKTEL